MPRPPRTRNAALWAGVAAVAGWGGGPGRARQTGRNLRTCWSQACLASITPLTHDSTKYQIGRLSCLPGCCCAGSPSWPSAISATCSPTGCSPRRRSASPSSGSRSRCCTRPARPRACPTCWPRRSLPSLVFTLAGGVIADRIAPQKVMLAGNLMIALGEGTFGFLVLTGHPRLWQMIVLEGLTGTGMAIFYPASQALLPRVVPATMLQEASAISRLAMNAGQMGGAVAGRACAWPRRPRLGADRLRVRPARHGRCCCASRSPPHERAGDRQHAPRPARGLVGVPLAHLAVGDRRAVRRDPDGLVRRVPGARPGGGPDRTWAARRRGARSPPPSRWA